MELGKKLVIYRDGWNGIKIAKTDIMIQFYVSIIKLTDPLLSGILLDLIFKRSIFLSVYCKKHIVRNYMKNIIFLPYHPPLFIR